MGSYEDNLWTELLIWQKKMTSAPSFTDRISKKVQTKINDYIPEKVHKVITVTMEKLFKAVLFSAQYTTGKTMADGSLIYREAYIKSQISFYQKSATVEGAVTGAGGILMGLADFPVLIGLKIKMLFDIAARYGFDVSDYRERLYILYIFQLSFSSQQRRNEVFKHISGWDNYARTLPEHAEDFDWRSFQQEYRDYIDLAKMAQLLPVIGAAVGAIANYKLVAQLGESAMNCYRLRLLKKAIENRDI